MQTDKSFGVHSDRARSEGDPNEGIPSELEHRIQKAFLRFKPKWKALNDEQRNLAKRITIAVERVGGRAAASELMGVASTSIDNYRAGRTQPKAAELLRLFGKTGAEPPAPLSSGPGTEDFDPEIFAQALAQAKQLEKKVFGDRYSDRESFAELTAQIYAEIVNAKS